VSDLQKTVLEAMDIDEYISPETESAERYAMRLDNLNILDSFKVSEKYGIVETKVPAKYVGMTLEEANLTNEYKVIVLTTIKSIDKVEKGLTRRVSEATGIAKSSTILAADD